MADPKDPGSDEPLETPDPEDTGGPPAQEGASRDEDHDHADSDEDEGSDDRANEGAGENEDDAPDEGEPDDDDRAADAAEGDDAGEHEAERALQEAADEAAGALGAEGAQDFSTPDWPSTPKEWITRGLAYRWLDYGVFQVERTLVVAALAAMSLMIFLEIVHLALVSDKSNLAEFFVRQMALRGNELDEGARATLTSTVIRLEVVAFLLLCYGAVATRMPKWPWKKKLPVALFVAAALAGLAKMVSSQPAYTSYAVVVVCVVVGSGLSWWLARRDAEMSPPRVQGRRNVFVALAVASPVLLWLASKLPEDYSFAQEYSLFLLLWVGFLGASMATYQKSHLRTDFVRKLIKGELGGHLYAIASLLVTLAFTCVLLIVAWDYVFNPETGMRTTRTAAGSIPDWVKVLAIPVSLAVMVVRFAVRLLEAILGGLRFTLARVPEEGGRHA